MRKLKTTAFIIILCLIAAIACGKKETAPASSDTPKEVVVHYGLIDEQNNIWGVSEEEGEKLGEVLFSADME